MLTKVLGAKLSQYAPENQIEQINVLQELLQHYVLAGLSRAGLFAVAMFHGGTCLRIVNGLNRFSEDLDFLLKTPDPGFRWHHFLNAVQKDCALEGILFDVQDKSRADTMVQKAFLTSQAIGNLLTPDPPIQRHLTRKIRIKLEIDTNPPEGSRFATSFITFPVTAALTTQTLESGFALKLHALLCRPYVKGRDWYDFVWYVARKTIPDLALLGHALYQQGPWAGQPLRVDPDWVMANMAATIRRIDWAGARNDVQRFLPLREQEGLRVWGADFFLHQLDRMNAQ